MSRTPMPMHVGDLSAFARNLRRQLDGLERVPSHLEMLNMLSRAGGFRNFQHLRTRTETMHTLEPYPPALNDADLKRIKNVVRHFDGEGRLVRWPGKHTLRMLCLWVMWARIPARTPMKEPEINALLERQHLFEDHALLRRELVDRGYLTRTDDGGRYTRVEQQPPMEAAELFRQLRDKAA